MRRRSVLRAAGAAVTVAGAAAVHTGRSRATAGESQAFAPLGTLRLDGLSEVVLDPTGQIAYGALRDGFTVVDVSDPTSPTELARVDEILADSEAGPLEDIYDVTVSGDRLLVAGPHVGTGSDVTTGFEVYDVADPAEPSLIAGTQTDHAVHNGYIDGETVFLTGTGAPAEPLVIYDIGGDDVEEVARWSVEDADPAWASVSTTFRHCHDVFVQNGVAYVAYWDAGTWLLDVSDPTSPSVIASIGGLPPETLPADPDELFPPGRSELPGNSHSAQPSPDGEVLAVGKEAGDRDETDLDGGPGGIELWDLSDPSAPTLHTVLAPPGEAATSHNFAWRDRRLFTSWHGDGVRVFDLDDPASPRLLADWADGSKASFWTAVPASDAVVASSFLDPRQDRKPRYAGVGATLYTFPLPGNAETSAARTMTRRPTPTVTSTRTLEPITSSATSDTGNATKNPSEPGTAGTTVPTSDGSPATEPADSPRRGTTGSTSTTPSNQPGDGFGVLALLAAGGIGAWRLLADSDRDD